MSNWQAISRDNIVAAKSLSQDSRWRSAVSRAYYAAHASVAGALEGRAEFPKDRHGPSHDRLPQLVMTYLSSLPMYERRRVATASWRLYQRRIDSDYKPFVIVDEKFVRESIQDAAFIIKQVAK